MFFVTACSYTFILFLDRVLLYEDHDAFHDDHDHDHDHADYSANFHKNGYDQSFGPQIEHQEHQDDTSFLLRKAESQKPPETKGEASLDLRRAQSNRLHDVKKE